MCSVPLGTLALVLPQVFSQRGLPVEYEEESKISSVAYNMPQNIILVHAAVTETIE